MQALAKLGATEHPDLLAGSSGFEDAGVFRLDGERALVQTVDFFPPVVDDPRWFGRIAAANALSDIYAMGAVPLTALNLVGWPKELDLDVLGEILAGGADKLREAGAVLCGGHSVVDHEVKYGMAVTGLVHPQRFWRNGGAQLGDVVLLTKPLGMGAVSNAIKKQRADQALVRRAAEQMATLNRAAAEAMAGVSVHGATDVTGFGLLGHGVEMADGAGLTLRLISADLPLFEGALELAAQGMVTGACQRGRRNLEGRVRLRAQVSAPLADVLFDAETSGGLLLAVPPGEADAALRRLGDAGVAAARSIGEFTARGDVAVAVE